MRPFAVSPLLDGRLLVFRTGESVREADFYSELWNAPGDMLADVIARWLGDSGLFSVVVPPGTAGTATDFVLEGWIGDLSGDWRDPAASKGVIDFRVALEPGSVRRILWHREYRAECPVTARTQDALVAAWNECLQDTAAARRGPARGTAEGGFAREDLSRGSGSNERALARVPLEAPLGALAGSTRALR